jgi:hypothetical protein
MLLLLLLLEHTVAAQRHANCHCNGERRTWKTKSRLGHTAEPGAGLERAWETFAAREEACEAI